MNNPMRAAAVIGLAVLAGCTEAPKPASADGNRPTAAPSSKVTPTPSERKSAELPTQEELQAKLKGKKRDEVIAIIGKPDREAAMDTEAGRMIYDRPIAKGSLRADVWFAQGVVDNVQW